jgi:hypothetical protein
MPDAPPPEGDAAAGGATRSGLPSIRDLGRRDAAPRKPWNSAPPTDADIAGARRKKRLDAEEGGGRRRSGVASVLCAREDFCLVRALRTVEGSDSVGGETTGTGLYCEGDERAWPHRSQ